MQTLWKKRTGRKLEQSASCFMEQVAASPLTIDLGKEVELSAFTYAPLKAEAKPTMAFRYKFYVSADGKNWKEVPANGEFSNIMHNPLPQTVTFDQKEKARFIKLEATTYGYNGASRNE